MMGKLLKKLAIAVAAAAISLTAVASAASAGTVTVKTVTRKTIHYTVKSANGVFLVTNGSGLKVYQKPSESSAKLGQISSGAKVIVTGTVYVNNTANGWVRINYKGQKAFVRRNIVNINQPAKKTTTTVTTTTTGKKNSVYTVKVNGYLALRKTADSNNANIIAKLHTGDKVVVLNKNNAVFWYVCVSSTGQCGYVNHSLLV